MINSLWTIPHIQDEIISHVTTNDVMHCQSVCRDWREVFTPVVWRVHDLSVRAVFCNNDHDRKRLEALARIGKHVQKVSMRLGSGNVESLEAIASYLPRVTKLTLNGAFCENVPWRRLNAIMLISFPQLKELVLYEPDSLEEFVSAMSGTDVAKRLRTLSFEDLGFCSEHVHFFAVLIKVMRCFPLLESFAGAARWVSWSYLDEDMIRQETFHFRNLNISGGYLSARQMMPFWRQCPYIEHFHFPWNIPWDRADDIEKFVTLFDNRGASNMPLRPVKVLQLSNKALFSDHQLTRIFRGCMPQHLTVIEMASGRLGPEAVRILLATQAESLQAITMSGRTESSADQSLQLQSILASCPKLYKLHVFFDTGVAGAALPSLAQLVHLRVDDIVSCPWVCRGLRDLVLPILCAPSDFEPVRAASGCVQESVVEQAMKQLGRMTRLERLSLEQPNFVQVGQPLGSLPLSLGEGGLQHLSELKQLRHLDVRWYRHQIGVAETEWMATHLPRLTLLE